MWQYNYTPSSDDIMHYGVLGMRWGHRKAKRLSNKINKINRREDKYENKILGKRSINRAKIEKKYDKKIQKAENKGDKNLIKVREHNKYAKLKDFDEGTEIMSKALRIGRENKTKYLELKKKSINDPSITETDSYKLAKSFFESQKKSERVYGKDMTLLQESAQIANGKSWTRKNLGDI